jgi:hypothetical protein
MKKIISLLLAFASLPGLAAAASPVDGTWIWDASNAKLPDRPDVYLLVKDQYDCKSCVPPISAKADGADHPVVGHPYSDAIAVTIVNPHVVKATYKKEGQITGLETLTIADDGNALRDAYEDHTESTAISSVLAYERIAPAPAGAHALSGSWRATKFESVSDNGSTFMLNMTKDGMSWKDMNGVGYDAKFDGKDYPMMGDMAHTMVSVKRLSDHSFEETDKRDSKVESVLRMTVSADGKTAQYTLEDRRRHATSSGTLHKKM